ncbi:TIGR00645 family protein [Rhodomicrobium sp. Az07]|uniref:TIGR00645 family protein n=1 Tax=Rhodomicrobium sp. Az07 TaxID=2839034 RepID=UPI001BEBBA66|nr:TIGR00645 family protein [Rhodomicrobium sp. Az07]MBT3069639.1 TIGR00645 family protein [Rhodomicrobium sp. Az07]
MKRIENALESGIFASRWMLAPFYLGLVVSLALLLVTFVREFVKFAPEVLAGAETGKVIVTVLSLVDIVMVANLVLIIVFAGYEIFVSKMHIKDHEDRPDWMGHITFSDLKIKLMGTIVAISGIELLKTFVNIKNVNQEEIIWRLVLHLTFVVSGVLFAVMDRMSDSHHKVEELEAEKYRPHKDTPSS